MGDYYQIVENIYLDNNFPSINRLYKLVKEANIPVSRKFVQTFLDEQTEKQLLQTQIKNHPEGHIVSNYLNEIWQMDIFDYSKFFESNNKYKYMLVCIDVFSRKAYIEPMLDKSSETAATTLKVILLEAKTTPKIITCDTDAAYEGKAFQQLLSEEKIVLDRVVVGDHHALGIIDRFARTLKIILSKIFIRTKSTRWINKIENVVNVYNKTPHSGILDLTPNDANKPENQPILKKLNYEKRQANKQVSDLKPTDKVRIYIGNFLNKKSEPVWSDEVYQVQNLRSNKVKLYGIDKYFLRQNLLKIPFSSTSTPANVIRQTPKYTNQI
jgi:transcriptional regulator with XRE-family HTH domain